MFLTLELNDTALNRYGKFTLEIMRPPLATSTAVKSAEGGQNTELVLHGGSIMASLAFFCGGSEPFKKAYQDEFW